MNQEPWDTYMVDVKTHVDKFLLNYCIRVYGHRIAIICMGNECQEKAILSFRDHGALSNLCKQCYDEYGGGEVFALDSYCVDTARYNLAVSFGYTGFAPGTIGFREIN